MTEPVDRSRTSMRPAAPNHDVAPRTSGVLLVNVGTPCGPDVASVRKYLIEFLADPLVIQLPPHMRWFQKSLARLIAWRRGPQSAEKYRQIWTERGSPLKAIMEDQAAALAGQLPAGWRVFLGMRYGEPSIASALQEVTRLGIGELVVVPLYPQFSGTTTGTVIEELYRAVKQAGLHINVTARTTWYDDAGYVNAQAHCIADFAAAHDLTPENSLLLFSAHGLPVSYVRRGDPYQGQIEQTVRLVRERLGWPEARCRLAYQSRLGPTEWLSPYLTSALQELAAQDERRVLVCPISFTVDCLETLEEIRIEARAEFADHGGELFVCPAVNTDERFITALKNLVIRGPRPVASWGDAHQSLIRQKSPRRAQDAALERLVLLGVTLPNRVGSGRGPALEYSEPDGLACAKKPHHEVQSFLETLRAETSLAEAFIWNTCQRFECYAWLRPGDAAEERNCTVADLRHRVFQEESPGLKVNTLLGAAAWHHLMRTIAGLNSGLPGDKDIVEQFRTAYQLAERAGTAGPCSRALVEEAVELARSIRDETAWGRIDPGYCHAALLRIHERLPLKLANCRHVVIGGSATSRSVLETLYEHFGVKEPSVTLVYRAHQGGQMKLLRKAVGHGRRLRVGSYTERAVLDAIADADIVHYGIDRDEPVLTAEHVAGRRDFGARPLFIVDFNTSGSTAGLDQVAGVTLFDARLLEREVEQFAESLVSRAEFPQIVQEAEAWIERRAPEGIVPLMTLPCEGTESNGALQCARCGKVLAPATTGSSTA